MKHRVIFLIIALITATSAFAQEGMAVHKLFTCDYKQRPSVNEVEISGMVLKSYGVTKFRSITAINDAEVADIMRRCVAADAPKAIGSEVKKVGGVINYALYTFSEKEGKYRYVFYRNRKKGDGKKEVTVLYVEGTATLKELKDLFKK